MKTGAIIAIALLCSLLLALLNSSALFACVQEDDNAVCAFHPAPKPTRRAPLNAPAPKAAAPQPTPAPAVPKGDSPAAALSPDGSWRTISPSSSVWYKIGESIGAQALDVWLDANGKQGIAFAVYGPNQMNPFTPDRPVGRGTFNKTMPEHDLHWSGQYLIPGAWYAIVSNYTGDALPYRLGSDQQAKGERNCIGYWETLSTGQYVYWVDCGMYHPYLR